MPCLRGWIYGPAQERPGTSGFAVVTNDRWNQVMTRVGVLPIRTKVEPFDAPYSIDLADGGHVVASRLVAPHVLETPLLGPVMGSIDPDTLAAVEDRLCAFLQIPELLQASPRIAQPRGDATSYAVWGSVYLAGAELDGERKRRIVISPNPWNAVSGMATLVRTTTSFERRGIEFPQIQAGRARACCGDATTFDLSAVRLLPRERRTPATATMRDMMAIARGLIVTHDLDAAVRRSGQRSPLP